MDLFDYIDVITYLKDKDFTNIQIGEKIGMTEDNVKQYSRIKNKVSCILGLAKNAKRGTDTYKVSYDTFSEGR